jgi:ATP-binding cassette subfamily B protein
MVMKLLETASAELTEAIRRRLPPGEEELIRVASDLTPDGRFGSRWVVVTRGRVLVVPPPPPEEGRRGEREKGRETSVFSPPLPFSLSPLLRGGDGGWEDVPVGDIAAAREEALVGGGCLEIARKDGPPLRVLHTASLAARFAEVARGIEQLRRGEPLLISGETGRSRCDKCRRLLPEKNGVCPACVRRSATLRRLTAYLRPYKGQVLLLSLASLLMTLTTLLPPVITRRIVDDVLVPRGGDARGPGDRLTLLGLLALALLGLRVLSWGAEWVHGWVVAWLGARVTADIRSQLYRQLEMLALCFHDKRAVGSLMSRVTNDAGTLQDFLIRGLPYVLLNTLTFLGIFGFMLVMNWPLALAVVLPVPLLWAWGLLFWGRMRLLYHKWWQAGAQFSAQLGESLSGARVVKAFTQEEREVAKFAHYNNTLLRANVRTNRSRAILLATMGLLTSFGVLALWLFGGLEVMRGGMTLGTLLAFYGYIWLFYGTLQWFGQINNWMTQAFAGAERIFEVLDAPAEGGAAEGGAAAALPPPRGRVAFRQVTFGYDPARPVLRGVDLEAAPGEVVALVGPSGAGKTTLMALLCRFYDPDAGRVELDGADVRGLPLKGLRDQVGVVPQEPFLFAGSIADNIRYGRPGAPLAEVVRAARAAHAHAFILAKADGYDSEVGERGGRLSGGERQRLAIARAVLRDPRILILDEATASVDAASERLIRAAVARLARGRTTFVIAHRLSAVRGADRLVVLDGGRVAEAGTYKQLIARRGLFYNLMMAQQALSSDLAGERKAVPAVDGDGLPGTVRDALKESPVNANGKTESPDDAPEAEAPDIGTDPDAVDPKQVRLSREQRGTLRLTIGEGRSYEKVQVVRCAPLSDPGRYIAFLDERGEEICMVPDPAELDDATRRVLDEELTRRYLTAVVQRIYSVRVEAGVAYFDVETDRGRREFIVQNAHESARRLGEQRLLLLDVDGNRFEVADLGALDRRSARLLARAL